MSFLAACCSSAPSDRRKKPGRSGSATSPSDRAAQAPTPTGRKRFRVGQPVEMLDERRAKAAYEAHEFRHPVSSKSLLELSWASQAQPRLWRPIPTAARFQGQVAGARLRCFARWRCRQMCLHSRTTGRSGLLALVRDPL